jgi:DNA-binding response OmpR family regulator
LINLAKQPISTIIYKNDCFPPDRHPVDLPGPESSFRGSPLSDPQTQDLHFLIVDDQFNVRRMVANFLRTFGHRNFVDAADGLKAQEKLLNHPVDFIICDWNMPNMTGLEFLKWVRSQRKFKDMPFLMVTAEMANEVVAEAVEEGVDDYIVKPFQAQTLRAKIESVMEKRDNPSQLDIDLAEGNDLLQQNKPQEALMVFKRAMEESPKSPRANFAMAQALEALNEDEKAVQFYEEAARISPKFLKALDALARLYEKLGKGDLAAAQIKKATKLSPRNAQRHMELGKLLLEQGNAAEGLRALEQANERAGGDANLTAEVGEVLLAAGLNAEAAEAFGRAVDMDPNQAHLYNRMGMAFRRQKRFKEAIEQYQKAIKTAPGDENLYYNLAVALAESGQYEASRKTLKQALTINPDFAEAQELLKRLAR